MRRRYFKLSVLLVAFVVASFGVAPLLASDNVQPVKVEVKGDKVNHRAVFELNFSSFSGLIRVAYQRVSDVIPFTPPALPELDLIGEEYYAPVIWLGKPGQNDPSAVTDGPGITDDLNPM